MAAISAQNKKLIKQLQADYPELTFTAGDLFKYAPPSTIFYTDVTTADFPLYLLHELGHYLIQQDDYSDDVTLIKIEAAAWAKSKTLAAHYQVAWDEDFAEDNLDTYRNWLHARSLCANCQINGYEERDGIYRCPLCERRWRP